MINKLNKILKFLKLNNQYNETLQIKFALNTININESSFTQLISLLYTTINTQSQPNMDNTAKFFQEIYTNSFRIETFHDFFKFIVKKSISDYGKSDVYNQLFKSMTEQSGWGPKTSALLIKNIYNYHHKFSSVNGLDFWDDVPLLSPEDKLFLPVDRVILTIFNEKLPSTKKMNFNSINKILKENFSNEDMLLFDDLWFWGFITQHGSSDREFKWNPNKYWTIKEADKNQDKINEISKLAEKFLVIIEE